MQDDTTDDTGDDTSTTGDTPASHASSEEPPDHTAVSTAATRTVNATDTLGHSSDMPVGRSRAKEADSRVVELDTEPEQATHGAENKKAQPILSQRGASDGKGE